MNFPPMVPECADTVMFASGFFGYAAAIRSDLEARGRRVAWFEDRPRTDTLSKAVLRVAPFLMQGMSDEYFDALSKRLHGMPIYDVLVIKGEALSLAAIRKLRHALPGARFTLYFWDSYRNMGHESWEKVSLFDYAFTFDPLDAEADQRLRYRPLFYLNDYGRLSREPADIDLLFVGTAHTDRFAVVQRIARHLRDEVCFRRVMYFPSRGLFEMRRILDPRMRGARSADFTFKPLSAIEVMRLVERARVILDIERTIQAGFTMRTMETLGAGRKLITTNPNVTRAEFFDPGNILVIDRQQPHISVDFIRSAYQSPPADVVRKFSLASWLDEILPHTHAHSVNPAENSAATMSVLQSVESGDACGKITGPG